MLFGTYRFNNAYAIHSKPWLSMHEKRTARHILCASSNSESSDSHVVLPAEPRQL